MGLETLCPWNPLDLVAEALSIEPPHPPCSRVPDSSCHGLGQRRQQGDRFLGHGRQDPVGLRLHAVVEHHLHGQRVVLRPVDVRRRLWVFRCHAGVAGICSATELEMLVKVHECFMNVSFHVLDHHLHGQWVVLRPVDVRRWFWVFHCHTHAHTLLSKSLKTLKTKNK